MRPEAMAKGPVVASGNECGTGLAKGRAVCVRAQRRLSRSCDVPVDPLPGGCARSSRFFLGTPDFAFTSMTNRTASHLIPHDG